MGETKLTSMDYLNIISYRDLFNWSVGYLLGIKFGYNNRYPLTPIATFLTRNKTDVDIQDNVLYTRVTIKTFGMGVSVRDKLYGEKIGTKKQFVIHSGQFLVSKIDARNGAFGVVPDEAEGAVITSNFWTFDVDTNKINPTYLTLLTSTKQFVLFAEKASNGTTNRHYLQENIFLEAKIPLPSLEEQNAMVAIYKNSISLAEKYEKQALEKKDSIQKYFKTQLGINNVNKNESFDKEEQHSYLRFYQLKDLLRWDCYNQSINIKSKYYQTISLSNLIVEKPKYGASYKASRKSNKIRYIRITDINEDGTLNEDFVSADQYDEKYLLKQDDFLIARSGNTVGKTFLYDDTCGKAIYAGYLIKFVLDKSKINPQYLLAYTKSAMFKQWIQGNMRVSAQPNINSQQYLESPIIVPPLDVQNEIVAHISELKEQIQSLRALAATTRTAAIQQFEQTIFK